MVNKYFKAFYFIAFAMFSSQLLAGPTGPPAPTPIDGGLFALIALALGYGVKKIHDISKK